MASFENFEPIFGEPVPERSGTGSDLLRRCLFHVYASDPCHLTVHVTDFISSSWEIVLSVSELDDMRDTVGIGGSWSEFVDYMVASLKSDNVKLVLAGGETAHLVSQKAKGMPRIVIPLKKMAGSSACEAMANLSLEVFRAFKIMQLQQENPRSSTAASGDQGKEEVTHSELDRPSTEKQDISGPTTKQSQDSPARETKPTKRVPAHQRTRKRRGALLQGSEDENG
ncbi:PREDICTED: uncharacterized protein LOC104818429 [Tarenaya hassleriana]|uniref:uncharacterized protein LOC104818429 n=1 Tax=Tarenaya hassleriana TaxID=28532 RepID=UPI00053C4A7B|nr:PREDICTED: uncharacterized protein LOC104818429 [Tarenaya hassleriana]